MAAKLADEILQDGAFSCLEQEAYVRILHTAKLLVQEFEALAKPFGISPTQYNVLRILRRQGSAGCACKTIGEHLITRDPDITRLLDRLEKRGLIARGRSNGEDRRVVTARITEAGLALVAELEAPMLTMHKRQMGRVSGAKLGALILALERVREGMEGR